MEDFQIYYGMSHNPFDKAGQTVIHTIDYKEMSFRLKYLTKALGIGLFTGRPGSGKTVILRDFAAQQNQNEFMVCYMPLSTVTVGDFYNQLAVSIGIGIEPAYRKSTKFKQIQERIIELHDIEHVTPLFILDEAQYLKGQIFNELILLTNFSMDGDKKCIVCLSGLPQVAQMLQRANFEAFRQRITVNYQVVGMDHDESKKYVAGKFQAAGVLDPIIEDEALKTIITNSGGSIRRLDAIVTQCLIIGAAQEKRTITNETVFQANSELALI